MTYADVVRYAAERIGVRSDSNARNAAHHLRALTSILETINRHSVDEIWGDGYVDCAYTLRSLISPLSDP